MDDISKQQSNDSPNKDDKPFTRAELIEQLQAYIDNFEKLPQHEKFSFALLCDMYYPLLIILGILRKGEHG